MLPGQFKINGLKSADINAVITNWFDIPRPARKLTLNTTPVKLDRALIYDDAAYENRTFTMSIGIKGNAAANRDKLLNVLDSGSYLDANFYLDNNYTYQIITADVIETTRPMKTVDYLALSIKVSAAPFKYDIDNDSVSVTDTATLTNPHPYASKPIITLTGTGDISLTVNKSVYNFKGIESGIVIDSSIQDAYWTKSGDIYNLNSTMSHSQFPLLNSGKNTISVSGATVSVEPRWRTL